MNSVGLKSIPPSVKNRIPFITERDLMLRLRLLRMYEDIINSAVPLGSLSDKVINDYDQDLIAKIRKAAPIVESTLSEGAKKNFIPEVNAISALSKNIVRRCDSIIAEYEKEHRKKEKHIKDPRFSFMYNEYFVE